MQSQAATTPERPPWQRSAWDLRHHFTGTEPFCRCERREVRPWFMAGVRQGPAVAGATAGAIPPVPEGSAVFFLRVSRQSGAGPSALGANRPGVVRAGSARPLARRTRRQAAPRHTPQSKESRPTGKNSSSLQSNAMEAYPVHIPQRTHLKAVRIFVTFCQSRWRTSPQRPLARQNRLRYKFTDRRS